MCNFLYEVEFFEFLERYLDLLETFQELLLADLDPADLLELFFREAEVPCVQIHILM